MPDFYLDYVVSFPGPVEDLANLITNVAKKGGGNLVGWKHSVGRGGNCSNLVAQLAKLGAGAVPIVETDALGHSILSRSLPGVDLSHVKTTGAISTTVSLEADASGRRANVMLSNPGSLASFGPEKLTTADREAVREADFVCVVNWAQNRKGTELAEEVFKMAKDSGATTFFDPCDPTHRSKDIQELNERVLTSGLVDILSVNENELTQLASPVRDESAKPDNPLFEAASVFSMLAVRVDLHTPEFSATFIDGQRVRVPCSKFQPAKVTGAGDAWNAADIFAQGIGLDHKERLMFANATSAAYLKEPGFEPSSLDAILRELEQPEEATGRQKLSAA